MLLKGKVFIWNKLDGIKCVFYQILHYLAAKNFVGVINKPFLVMLDIHIWRQYVLKSLADLASGKFIYK